MAAWIWIVIAIAVVIALGVIVFGAMRSSRDKRQRREQAQELRREADTRAQQAEERERVAQEQVREARESRRVAAEVGATRRPDRPRLGTRPLRTSNSGRVTPVAGRRPPVLASPGTARSASGCG